jgi:hypothetical protein
MPADYPMLRHHAALATQGRTWGAEPLWQRNRRREVGNEKVIEQLWQRLRALPEFPWRQLAKQTWQSLRNEDLDHGGHEALRAAAALAGEATALNTLLEWEPHKDRSYPDGMSPADWAELAALIDGIPPPGPERTQWLRDNRGHFAWDSTRGRYAVKN